MHSTRRGAVVLFRMASVGLVLVLPMPTVGADADGKIVQPGIVRAYDEAHIGARINGFIKEWKADLGARVRKGDVLAVLDAPELEIEYQEKKARLLRAEIGVEQAKRALAIAEAAAIVARAKTDDAMPRLQAELQSDQAGYDRWKAEYERGEKLLKEGVFNKQELEMILHEVKTSEQRVREKKTRIDGAKASYDEAVARRDKAKIDIEAAKISVKVAKSEVERVQALLENTRILAPFDGVVTKRNISIGDFVGPQSKWPPGPMFVVSRIDRVRIVVEVPETQALRVTEGMKAVVRVPLLKDERIEAAVALVAPSFDIESRTMTVEIDLPNPGQRIRPGMTVNVELVPADKKK